MLQEPIWVKEMKALTCAHDSIDTMHECCGIQETRTGTESRQTKASRSC
ncbi:uncharacterized protein CMC5_046920 [Chondromyces crocatus]|uniref:Uncharacterized protein n=1 Tax=Chondromyces crocatus TaxID=52 RepID=A0A0K1EIM5_CHOCO|nr:uncharacterized protein CMC5_046920 [Chondromyces crocatus]